MKILISGVCGFVGSCIAKHLARSDRVDEIVGFDNFSRPGSWTNLRDLEQLDVRVVHADARCSSDIENLPSSEWLIDAAASPSVISGLNATLSTRQLVETNLYGTVNMLEYCRQHSAGFVLLSTSRVYSIEALQKLPLKIANDAFRLDQELINTPDISTSGIRENFSTAAPVSLYGATKLSSETLALEYANAASFPVWINRCGVLAGAGQFGQAEQGIYAFWLHSWRERAKLKYLGFGGHGFQVRDCLHPSDLAELILLQILSPNHRAPRIANVSGGMNSALSLAQLSAWCAARWGSHVVAKDGSERPYDLPWLVLDNELAATAWNWQPKLSTEDILEEIALHADANPDWLQLSKKR